ncbi:hypothetical protein FI667_g14707, partial [Globisporangium splendens]
MTRKTTQVSRACGGFASPTLSFSSDSAIRRSDDRDGRWKRQDPLHYFPYPSVDTEFCRKLHARRKLNFSLYKLAPSNPKSRKGFLAWSGGIYAERCWNTTEG